MRRREFITLASGVAAMWPLAVRAQQPDRMRRVGVLTNVAESDPEAKADVAAFVEELRQLGWTEGRNVQIDYRWAAGDLDRIHKNAIEILALEPDVILAAGSSVPPLLQATRTVPIVFVLVVDPVGAGIVDNLAHPGGNVTGYAQFEYSLSSKWLQLLKEIAPNTTHVAVFRDPTISNGAAQFGAIQVVASAAGVELMPGGVRDPEEIERVIASVARKPNGGFIVAASPLAVVHRNHIVKLAASYKVPAVYFIRPFVADGGLISYGPNFADQYRRAADYIDRILRGAKPADLPIQAPTKYELVINLKTAKSLGLSAPASLISRADEVIE